MDLVSSGVRELAISGVLGLLRNDEDDAFLRAIRFLLLPSGLLERLGGLLEVLLLRGGALKVLPVELVVVTVDLPLGLFVVNLGLSSGFVCFLVLALAALIRSSTVLVKLLPPDLPNLLMKFPFSSLAFFDDDLKGSISPFVSFLNGTI